ncbi:regulator of volume decrease after cellular swelling-domain-containing protein [Panaeolus papilionaceus]|nr:regulator of volume decrease after cellular swelling-domain-containing protein [Panaeolus papilionaceus]
MSAVKLITTLPTFASPQQHQNIVASTPSSFSDIPPVVKHQEPNVSVTLNPPLDGFSSTDPIQGTLYVLTSALTFMSSTGTGFEITYPTITLHALSRAATGPSQGSPSIYCQLDEGNTLNNNGGENNDEDITEMRELIIIPQNADALEPIFEAMSHCAALHPDPSDDEEDGLDDAFIDTSGNFEVFNGNDDEELSEVGKVRSDFINDNRFAPY